ncbi:hypothetical protein SpCBS45565_g07185 [Spizellomyces sp. 'palustris']|nr:hypothetical protein SpCBS45565_g07185 [Spizellomyces sp. 'palustris']
MALPTRNGTSSRTSDTVQIVDVEPTSKPASSDHATMKDFYVIAAGYILFTLTDTAVRMIVLFGLWQRHFQALNIAIMFSSYEALGVVTNLFGGIMGSRLGLRFCLLLGLLLQLVGISLLFVLDRQDVSQWSQAGVTGYVVFAQSFSGAAKDLVKLAGKSSTKLATKAAKSREADAGDPLFKLVAWLTGAKNSVKGLGFLIGAVLINYAGLWRALLVMVVLTLLPLPGVWMWLDPRLGISKDQQRLTLREIFDKGRDVNMLSLARVFLFGSRDLWFEIALPIWLRAQFDWNFTASGAFLAVWIIIYGAVQTITPQYILKPLKMYPFKRAKLLVIWTGLLMIITAAIAAYLTAVRNKPITDQKTATLLIISIGLAVFAFVFAVNSSIHSYLIVAYAAKDKVAINVGFYYCANAFGRLTGTLLSGFMFQYYGIWVCIWTSVGFLAICTIITAFFRDVKDVN